jgi:Tfp pilus assembly protein PilO
MLSQIKTSTLYYALLGLAALLCLSLILVLQTGLAPKPAAIRRLYRENTQLQEKLISAQITSQRLRHVQELIANNLALSSRDTLAQGASLTFLKDLALVLDKLQITLLSLDPEKVATRSQSLETPYRMDILCNYGQFAQLINKMEKSPQLISLKSFEIKNDVNDYFGERKQNLDQCQITLRVTTLTLIKKSL